MNRRQFFAFVGGTAALPLFAVAQQSGRARPMATVGILSFAAAQDARVNEFRHELRQLGYVEGQNIAINHRWADGRLDRLPELAAELVTSNVDVILALGPSVWAAKRATSSIPIVIGFSGDPVGQGVVSNLARPGENLTGFSYMSTDLAAKRLELASQAFPGNARIAILYNPAEPATVLEMRETEAAARAIGVALQPLATRGPDDIEPAYTTARRERADALIVFTHGFAVLHRGRIIELAARHRLPTLYGWREFVQDGGLVSYGPDMQLMMRKAASYVDRILKGEKPGDLPVEQPARLELIVNLRTAAALGLTIPPSILLRADEVIE